APPRPKESPPASEEAKAGFVARLRAALAKERPAHVVVTVASSDELERFARDIAEAAGHPDLKAAIGSGDLRFDLARGGAAAAAKPIHPGGTYEMTSGVLSETKIVEIARTHRKIVVGGGVVLTPLARDKAREMRIELTRQKP
ncbi:MAG TPA: hypothetical protein VFK86_17005, partial [Bauldia sp.]|nr:hypothetical protein [Bauldia sp.]